MVNGRTQVPREFVKGGEIVLNISFSATSGLKMDNDVIHFHARFGGVSKEIVVPVENVVAIYARENGQGMAFEVSHIPASNDKATEEVKDVAALEKAGASPMLSAVPSSQLEQQEGSGSSDKNNDPETPKKGGRPTLTRIK